MRYGFILGAVLMTLGLGLQGGLGPVEWDKFAWPVNIYVLAGFLICIATLFLLRKKVAPFRFLGTYQAVIPTMVYAVVLTMAMGLTRQETGGIWLHHMLTFWPFVLIYVLMAFILGMTILIQLKRWAAASFSPSSFHFSLLLHLGLFLAMTTATLGNADVQHLKMVAFKDAPESRALTAENTVYNLPLTIELKRFLLDTYADGTPKRFASELQIQTSSGSHINATVDVNQPVEVDGWKIYQYGYDTQEGARSRYSILELVRDPWLPWVYAGIIMMLAGALCMFLFKR